MTRRTASLVVAVVLDGAAAAPPADAAHGSRHDRVRDPSRPSAPPVWHHLSDAARRGRPVRPRRLAPAFAVDTEIARMGRDLLRQRAAAFVCGHFCRAWVFAHLDSILAELPR